MAASVVPFTLPGCRLDSVQADPSRLVVGASSKARDAVCPACGHRSRRVHGLYTRSPSDLPVSDRAVGLRLRVRRFRCLNAECPRQTFAEPFPDLAARHARRTDRLATAQVRTGLAVGAETGARLLGDLRMATSPDTVLRLVHRHPAPAAETPRVLGVDDPPPMAAVAWRKGRAWGTGDRPRSPSSTSSGDGPWTSCRIGRRPRSPSGSATTPALRSSPGTDRPSTPGRSLRVLRTRFRSRTPPAVAGGGTSSTTSGRSRDDRSSPRHLTSVRGRLKALPGTENLPADGPRPRRRSRAEQRASAASRNRHLARYTEVRRLHAEEGLNTLQIARSLRISRTTVRGQERPLAYLAADAFPERGRHSVPPSILAPYQGHLNARWVEGVRSALGLWREIQALGYSGSSRPVSLWAQGRRTEPHGTGNGPGCTPKKYLTECPEAERALPRRGRLPPTRRLAWLLVRDPESLTDLEAVVLAHVRQDAEVAALHELARSYTRMVREKRADNLDGWLTACRASGIGTLVTFGEGLRQDRAAVRAALEEPWSGGQAEGQINGVDLSTG